jgi:hypothetical protein
MLVFLPSLQVAACKNYIDKLLTQTTNCFTATPQSTTPSLTALIHTLYGSEHRRTGSASRYCSSLESLLSTPSSMVGIVRQSRRELHSGVVPQGIQQEQQLQQQQQQQLLQQKLLQQQQKLLQQQEEEQQQQLQKKHQEDNPTAADLQKKLLEQLQEQRLQQQKLLQLQQQLQQMRTRK